MKIHVCDICKNERTLVAYYGSEICSPCSGVIAGQLDKMVTFLRKDYDDTTLNVHTFINWLKMMDRKVLVKNFGTNGIELLDKILEKENEKN